MHDWEKVCKFVIDSGSCENVVVEKVVKKLGSTLRNLSNCICWLGLREVMMLKYASML